MKQRIRRDKVKQPDRGQDGQTWSSREMDTVTDNHMHQVKDRSMFPLISPWIITVLTMAVRVNYVLQPHNWWILHPDEIYQTLEVAHSEVYGYGFRTYEYLKVSNQANMTQMQANEVNLGMRNMRSFLLPRFFILVSWVAENLGNNSTPFLLWKVAHVVVASCLPYAVFKFTERLFRSRDTGVIAAILTAGSTHLSVFGTHTLINSLIATPVFLALSLLFAVILQNTKVEEKANQKSFTKDCDIPVSSGASVNGYVHLYNGHTKDLVSHLNGSAINGIPYHNGNVSDMNGSLYHERKDRDENLRDLNMNILPEKPRPEHVSAQINQSNVFFASFVIVLCCYIRADITLFIATIIIPFSSRKCLRKEMTVPVFFGIVTGVTIGVFDDFYSYGFGIVSPYYWLQFNVVKDFSARLYGSMEWSMYACNLFSDNPALTTLLAMTGVTFYLIYKSPKHQLHPTNLRTVLKLCISGVLLLIIYSMKRHKELRFLHNFLVLLFIIFAWSITTITHILTKTKYFKTSHIFITFTLLAFLASQWYVFPSSKDQSVGSWTYSRNTESHDVNSCLDYVSRQNDVTGVFTDHPIHMTGAYTILHRDVPLMGLMHYEYYEFSYDTRTTLQSVDYISPTKDINVNTFSLTSEFISIYNKPYLVKQILFKKEYNYLIIGIGNKFPNKGYDHVFQSGTMRVLKRNPGADEMLATLGERISVVPNINLLLYETDWLIKLGEYKVARRRLLEALKMESSNVEVYKRLALSYTLAGDLESSGIVMGKCIKAVSKKLCYGRPVKIVLHEEYNI